MRDENHEASERVNDVAKGLFALAKRDGFALSVNESQALSVIGLLAAAEVKSGEKLSDAIEFDAAVIVAKILEGKAS